MKTDRHPEPLLRVEEILPILNRISLLGGLTDRQLYVVFRCLEQVSYRAGEVIFEEGDSPSHLYIIKSGDVKLIAGLHDNPLELIQLDTGKVLGETAVISIHRHTASAVAVSNTELIVFPREALFGLHKTEPELFGLLMLNIAREACRRLIKAEDIMLHYASKNGHHSHNDLYHPDDLS